jgi:serine/threonine protein kinase
VRVPLEVALLSRVQHVDGVIKLLDYFDVGKRVVIVLERPLPSKDLFDYITEQHCCTETECRDLFRQIVTCVFECYKAGVLHRDIKDENILLNTQTRRIRLIDFGSGAFVKDADFTDFEGE